MRARRGTRRPRRSARVERLEPRLALAVTTIDPFPDVNVSTEVARQSLPVMDRFDDAAVTGSLVRFGTNLAAPFDQVFFELFDAPGPDRPETTPGTAENFLRYVDAGRYTNTFIHRSVPGFVIQGGGYRLANGLPHIDTFAPIKNEFAISNTRGTIAMAKIGADAPGGGPDSATSEWFVNLKDNSGNLDGQNGGFTVFGRVLGSGMALFDAIATQLPTNDIRAVFNNGALDETPLLGIPNPIPDDFQFGVNNFVHFPVVERVGELILTVSSSDPTLVAPSFVTGPQGPQLQLDHAGGRAGTAVITVRAESIFDARDFVEDRFSVVLTTPPRPPTDVLLSSATVAENQPAGTVVGTLSAVDPDVGGSHAYALVDGAGSADNASFRIVGNELRTTAAFNFEARTGYSVRVRVTDQGGLTFEKVFSITVTDVADEPLLVESIAPPAAGFARPGTALSFTVRLSEGVVVVGKPQLQVRVGTSTRAAVYVGGSGTAQLTFQYVVGRTETGPTVTVGPRFVFPRGSSVAAGAESLAAVLPVSLAGTAAPGVVVDTVAPKAAGPVGVPANATYGAGQTLQFVVTFTENVIVSGTPRIALKIGSLSVFADYVSGSGGTALVFRYVVRPGDAPMPSRGIAVGKRVEIPAGAAIVDQAGNAATLTLRVPSTTKVLVATTIAAKRPTQS